jgi:iron complex transport system substrate-binding protein
MRAAAEKCKTIGRMARTPAAAVLCLLVWTNAARAQSSLPAGRESVQGGFREVTDETGRTVRIPRDIRRIVSLAPSLTETIYALGLQDRLVGDTDFCDYPPAAREKQKIGGAINPNIEIIAKLHPDLVLAIKSLNRLETVEALQSLEIPSYTANPKTIDEILSSIQRLSTVLDAPTAGAKVAGALRDRLTKLQERLRAVPPKRVLFVVWDEPLISIGRGTFIADALRYAGAVSVVDSSQDWPQVNLEEVVRQQPDFLVFAATHSEKSAVDVQALAKWPGWRGLEAVRERRFAVISEAVNRPSPRIVGAIEDLARQLHPEAFGNGAESAVLGVAGSRREREGEPCAL